MIEYHSVLLIDWQIDCCGEYPCGSFCAQLYCGGWAVLTWFFVEYEDQSINNIAELFFPVIRWVSLIVFIPLYLCQWYYFCKMLSEKDKILKEDKAKSSQAQSELRNNQVSTQKISTQNINQVSNNKANDIQSDDDA